MRNFWLSLIYLLALPLGAEVSVISVTDTTQHSQKEDFYHTFEYFISSPGKQSAKCQATRIAPRWFATAAHCVYDLCQKQCTLQVDLLEQPVSVLASVLHTAKNPAVFVHPNYNPQQVPQDDFALFRLDLYRAPKMYYRRASNNSQPNMVVSEADFTGFLNKNRRAKSQYRHVLSPSFPPIAEFDPGNYVLDRNLSVIAIFDGKREVKPNPYPVYYVKELGYAYTSNFGIRKGMSGSGVMTNTGELVGIISAMKGADWFRGNKKTMHVDWFVFSVFNQSLVSFMRSVMGSDFNKVERKDAYPYLVKKTRKNFASVVAVVKGNPSPQTPNR